MNVRVASILVFTIATGCHPEDDMASRRAGENISAIECEWLAAPLLGDADAVLCDLEFREIVRLEGSVEGIAPRGPVQALRDGTYVSGTYLRGRLAVWGPDGQLLDVLGTGPGDGPGEFDYATSLAETSDGEFYVFAATPLVHRYSTTKGFLRSFRLPALGGASSATHEGAVIVSVAVDDGWRAFQIEEDSVQAQGVWLGLGRGFAILSAAEDVGVWSANTDRYVLRRHTWPGGALVDSLVVSRDWVQGPGARETLLYALQADSRGLIWALTNVPDPDAPSQRRSAEVDAPVLDLEESEANAIRSRDYVIEAFTPGGRLVASVRFDSFRDAPHPIPGGLWYRPTEDELSLIVLKAFLAERE